MESIRLSGKFDPQKRSTLVPKLEAESDNDEDTKVDENDLVGRIQTPSPLKQASRNTPPGVNDFDKENWNEPFSVSNYAMDIFEYLKGREVIRFCLLIKIVFYKKLFSAPFPNS